MTAGQPRATTIALIAAEDPLHFRVIGEIDRRVTVVVDFCHRSTLTLRQSDFTIGFKIFFDDDVVALLKTSWNRNC